MEVLDLRTYRDLQYVRNTENLMKVVDGKLKVASENPRSLNPKGFQVTGRLSPVVSGQISVIPSLFTPNKDSNLFQSSQIISADRHIDRSAQIQFKCYLWNIRPQRWNLGTFSWMIKLKRENFLCQFEYSSLYILISPFLLHSVKLPAVYDSTFRDQRIHSCLFPPYLSANSGSAATVSERFCLPALRLLGQGSVFVIILQMVHRKLEKCVAPSSTKAHIQDALLKTSQRYWN